MVWRARFSWAVAAAAEPVPLGVAAGGGDRGDAGEAPRFTSLSLGTLHDTELKGEGPRCLRGEGLLLLCDRPGKGGETGRRPHLMPCRSLAQVAVETVEPVGKAGRGGSAS